MDSNGALWRMSSITSNLPWFISEPLTDLIGKKCYASLVENLDLGDSDCVKLSISKVLGLGIVVGGSIVKIPQVLLIVRSGSARGLSLPAFTLETLGYAFSLAYSARNNFPFSTYGENLFLTMQNILVTLLIVYHAPTRSGAKNTSGVLVGTLATSAIIGALLVLPHDLLPLLQLSTLPIGLVSKIPQIASNARARSTGNLSAIAVGAQVAGCAARLFTTATELDGDAYVLWGFVLALVLNGIIGLQMWAYWGNDGISVSEKKRETAPIAVASLPAQEYPREKAPELSVPTQYSHARPTSPAGSYGRAGSLPPGSPNAAGNRKWTRKID